MAEPLRWRRYLMLVITQFGRAYCALRYRQMLILYKCQMQVRHIVSCLICKLFFWGLKCRISLPQSCTRFAVFGNSRYIPSILLASVGFNRNNTTVLSVLSFCHTKSKKEHFSLLFMLFRYNFVFLQSEIIRIIAQLFNLSSDIYVRKPISNLS